MSTAIDTIKTELVSQKSEIEKKGGVVNVHNINPTPTEITAGIKTIPSLGPHQPTATATDVLKGKTFYGVSGEYLTGNYVALVSQEEFDLVFNNYSENTTPIDYHIPAGTIKLRDYFYVHSSTHTNIYLNEELQEIGEYSFWENENTSIMNFATLQHLNKIGKYSMKGIKGIDFSNFPTCLKELGQYCFADSQFPETTTIKVPGSVTTLGDFCLMGNINRRSVVANVDLSTCVALYSKGMLMYHLMPNLDYVTESNIHLLPMNFMFGGGPRSITITENVTTVGNNIIGNANNDNEAYNICNEVVFMAETPPSFSGTPLGPTATRVNTSVYVPDQSVEAYKANSSLYQISLNGCIKPMSQRP